MIAKFEFRLHITGPEEERDFVIPQGETLIGREPGNDLPLVYPMISRRHAVLRCSASECTLTDLESANGTLVNGARLNPNEPAALEDGMRIAIGPFELICSIIALAEEESPQAEQEPAAKPAQEAALEKREAAKPRPTKKAERPAKAKSPGLETDQQRQPESPEPPPGEPPSDGRLPGEDNLPPWERPIPGLTLESLRLIQHLPGIYDTAFMRRFLGLFESILLPIEWNADHFDLYLDPGTSPETFLPWLSAWYEIVFDSTWTESQRRTLLKEAHQIHARRGTRASLSRLIEIYTGAAPEIIEFADPNDPFTFTIKLPIRERDANRQLLEQLIDTNKPAHTSYQLEFRK
jgi:phage tail-like protein